MKNQTLSFLHTVATFSPNQVNLLATKYGYVWPEQNDEKRLGFLIALWEDVGDQALADIALIHPDRELICQASIEQASKETKELPVSVVYNADGTEASAQGLPKMAVIEKELTGAGKFALFVIIAGLLILIINNKD